MFAAWLSAMALFCVAVAVVAANPAWAKSVDVLFTPPALAEYKRLMVKRTNSYTAAETDFLCVIGEKFRERKRIGEAKAIFEKLRKANCLTPNVLCGSAFTYMDDLDDTPDAVKAVNFLNQAIAIDKNCSKAYCRLAEIALIQDRAEQSLTLVNRAIKCPNMYAYSYLIKARALSVLKRFDQAYQAVLDAEKYNGNCASVSGTKAAILEQLGRDSEAAAAYRQNDCYHPSDWARHHIVNSLLKAGKPEEALKETARLLEIVPNDPDVFRLRSSIYKKLKNYPAALKDLDRAIASEPSSIAYKERADLHVRMGNMEKSKADLAAARKILE